MKIIEALKELKLIRKKIENNYELISRYSTQPSNEIPFCGTEDAQRKEIIGLIESNRSLEERRRYLKMRIEYTNLYTIVSVKGKKYNISELLQLRQRGGCDFMIKTYNSLNVDVTRNNIRQHYSNIQQNQAGAQPIVPKMYYDEKTKNEGISYYTELSSNIDSALEIACATIDLMELPDCIYSELGRKVPA